MRNYMYFFMHSLALVQYMTVYVYMEVNRLYLPRCTAVSYNVCGLLVDVTWPGLAQGWRGGRPRALSECMVGTLSSHAYLIAVRPRMWEWLRCRAAGVTAAERAHQNSARKNSV